MKNQPGTMKNRLVTMKNHENRPGTLKNQPGMPNIMFYSIITTLDGGGGVGQEKTTRPKWAR